MDIIGLITRTIFGIQANNRSLDELIQQAEAGGQKLNAHLVGKPDNEKNRKQMMHIIGIERWGQRRLKTILGEPPVDDEYERYQPSPSLDLDALRQEFGTTRAETLQIVHEIQQKGNAEQVKALHNGMGNITLKTWLRYLTVHAQIESSRIR